MAGNFESCVSHRSKPFAALLFLGKDRFMRDRISGFLAVGFGAGHLDFTDAPFEQPWRLLQGHSEVGWCLWISVLVDISCWWFQDVSSVKLQVVF